MNNEDMTRFYEVGTDLGRPGDFVRRDKDGNVPGSMKLNEYVYTIHSKPSYKAIGRVHDIMHAAKGRVFARANFSSYSQAAEVFYAQAGSGTNTLIIRDTDCHYGDEIYFPIIRYYNYMTGEDYMTRDSYIFKTDGTVSHTHDKFAYGAEGVQIIYYNDTEII